MSLIIQGAKTAGEQILNVDHAHQLLLIIDHREFVDQMFSHQGQGGGHPVCGLGRFAGRGHDFGQGDFFGLGGGGFQAEQIAVGEDPA